MEIVNEFTVSAAPDSVFRTLLDFERVGPCVPGASVGAQSDDGSYPAQIAVRLGPMRLNYRGTVRLSESDGDARHAIMVADVREVRGQGNAKAQMGMDVLATEGGSQVIAKTNVVLSGRAAQLGAGIVEDVAARLVADMAANLEQLLQSEAASPPPLSSPEDDAGQQSDPSGAGRPPAPPPRPAKPISGFRLLLRAFWHRLRNGRHRRAVSGAATDK